MKKQLFVHVHLNTGALSFADFDMSQHGDNYALVETRIIEVPDIKVKHAAVARAAAIVESAIERARGNDGIGGAE